MKIIILDRTKQSQPIKKRHRIITDYETLHGTVRETSKNPRKPPTYMILETREPVNVIFD